MTRATDWPRWGRNHRAGGTAHLSDGVAMGAVVLPGQNLMPLNAGSLWRKRPVVVAEEDAAVAALDALVLTLQPLAQMQPVMPTGLFRLFRFMRPMPKRILRHGTRDLQ